MWIAGFSSRGVSVLSLDIRKQCRRNQQDTRCPPIAGGQEQSILALATMAELLIATNVFGIKVQSTLAFSMSVGAQTGCVDLIQDWHGSLLGSIYRVPWHPARLPNLSPQVIPFLQEHIAPIIYSVVSDWHLAYTLGSSSDYLDQLVIYCRSSQLSSVRSAFSNALVFEDTSSLLTRWRTLASKSAVHTALFQNKVSQIAGFNHQQASTSIASPFNNVPFRGGSLPTAEIGLSIAISQQISTSVAFHPNNGPFSVTSPLADAPSSPVDIATHVNEAMSKIPSHLALPVFRSRHIEKIDLFVGSLVNLVSQSTRDWLQQQIAIAAELFEASWSRPRMRYTQEQQKNRQAKRRQRAMSPGWRERRNAEERERLKSMTPDERARHNAKQREQRRQWLNRMSPKQRDRFHARRRRQKLEYLQKMSPEEREAYNAKGREYMRQKLGKMSPEERKRYNTKQQEQRRNRLQNLSPEEKEKLKAKRREANSKKTDAQRAMLNARQRELLRNEPPEQREKRLAKGREAARKRRENMTEEQRKKKNAKEVERVRKLSAEEREKKNTKQRESARNLPPEEKQRRIEKNREYQKKLPPEEKERRRLRKLERKRERYHKLSAEERKELNAKNRKKKGGEGD